MDDLKLIKKYYGEDMMHFCRDNLSTLLEKNVLFKLLNKYFYKNKDLYNDLNSQGKLVEFSTYLLGLVNENQAKEISTDETPFEMMEKAGYVLYECKSEEDIQKFKKYYKKGEELCTFKGNRLDNCYVFFAVKKNVDEILRSNFKKPYRQDEYGTSVISIQFTRGNNNFVSIKNRYNHTVSNPDATFSNNLDKIIPGLKYSFKKYYDFNISRLSTDEDLEIDNYVLNSDEKYYKYNYEIDNIYYCPNNIIIDNYNVIDSYSGEDSARYILMDYFILDLKEKDMYYYLPESMDADNCIVDDFINLYNKKIISIDIQKNKKERIITITTCEGTSYITIDSDNRIIKYINNYVKELKSKFLLNNIYLEELEMNGVTKIGDNVLENNEYLNKLVINNVTRIGNRFLADNSSLEKIDIPLVENIGDFFIGNNEMIEDVNMPNLRNIGNDFLASNNCLVKLSLPNVRTIRNTFMPYSYELKELYLPKVENIGNFFMYSVCNCDDGMEYLELPSVKNIGHNFMKSMNTLKEVIMPKVCVIGDNFLYSSEDIAKISMPKLRCVGDNYLYKNKSLLDVSFSSLKETGNNFMIENCNIFKIIIPNIELIGSNFLKNASLIEKLYLPRLIYVGDDFLLENTELNSIYTPKLTVINSNFLYFNKKLKNIDLPNCDTIGSRFMYCNQILENISIPVVETIESDFLFCNKCIQRISAPKLLCVADNFMPSNASIKEANFPVLEEAKSYFMSLALNIEDLYVPSLNNYMGGSLPNIDEFIKKSKEKSNFMLLVRKEIKKWTT